MKLPRSIDVYGKKWSIKYRWNPKDDDGNHALGLCVYDSREIIIDQGSKKEERLPIFLHELFHAIIYELKLRQTSLTSDVEEIIVDNFAEYLNENFCIKIKK